MGFLFTLLLAPTARAHDNVEAISLLDDKHKPRTNIITKANESSGLLNPATPVQSIRTRHDRYNFALSHQLTGVDAFVVGSITLNYVSPTTGQLDTRTFGTSHDGDFILNSNSTPRIAPSYLKILAAGGSIEALQARKNSSLISTCFANSSHNSLVCRNAYTKHFGDQPC